MSGSAGSNWLTRGKFIGNALRRRNRMRCCGLKGGTGQRVWGVLIMSQAEVGLAELALGMWPALVRPTEVDKSKSNDLNDPRRLLDVLPAAIYVTDAEGRITYFNDAAAPGNSSAPTAHRFRRISILWRLPSKKGNLVAASRPSRSGQTVRAYPTWHFLRHFTIHPALLSAP
jgi:hypothetical protein